MDDAIDVEVVEEDAGPAGAVPAAASAEGAALRAAAARGGATGALLDAIATAPRAEHLPHEVRPLAGDDVDLPVGHGGLAVRPGLVAALLGPLLLERGHRVLEVGASTGWTTDVLLELGCRVEACERVAPLARRAAAILARTRPGAPVVVSARDALRLGPPAGPFDRIVVWAPLPRVPRALAAPLVEGGILTARIADRDGERVLAYRRRGDALVLDGALPPARVA